MDQLVDTGLSSDLGDSGRNVDVDILVLVVASLPVTSGKVVDSVRVTHTFVDLVRVASVPFKRNDLSEVTSDTEVTLRVLVAVWKDNLRALLGQLGYEVATQEAGAAKDGNSVSGNSRTAASWGSSLGNGCWAVSLGLVEDSKVVRRLQVSNAAHPNLSNSPLMRSEARRTMRPLT